MPMQTQHVADLGGVALAREHTRKRIAYIAILVFFGIIALLVGAAIWSGMELDDSLQLISATGGVLGGVVGAIIGFYFRSQD